MSSRSPSKASLARIAARIAKDEAFAKSALSENGALAIRMARGKRSLRDLSRRSGLSPTYLSRVETGQMPISLGAFTRLVSMIGKE